MEDLADIPLELHFAAQPMVKVAVEVVSVKSYTLRAKLRTNAQIDDIDLSQVTEARIEARNPVFLIEELRKAFIRLGEENGYEDDFDMQWNLCENIEFVFGPPGTGKTTHVARDIILPMMHSSRNLKVLVLTPTNKSADVLVRRLMESMGSDQSYVNWLVRFGATNDNTIEQSGIFRDKTFDIRTFSRNVTVTTIARFPYDYFLPDEGTRLHLSELKWDYIIIDEASMIPLANIVYPLYKKTPEKFIIAGDPFQIEPITTVDTWKNENIYTMVELKSFTETTTVPHKYHVELLTTQYRSIPEIGEVFSRFAYGGVLKHYRTSESQRTLQIEDFIDIKPLTIIKFPVSKFESIYRPKRLQGKTPYQVYSALFSLEFVKYLATLIELVKGNEKFRIGLIAPYRAQADLIDKLMTSVVLPQNVDVQVGTIHGFQGDECDIIIALFNPPPKISSHKDMFLNKLNIVNVSISRARDYLIVLMPDDETENVDNLTLIKKVEQLCKDQSDCIELHSPEIEELIFGSKSYLEDNSFSTIHQLVNVYGKPEKYYEIRSEDAAVDVQIHEQQEQLQHTDGKSTQVDNPIMESKAPETVTHTINNSLQSSVVSEKSALASSNLLKFYWLRNKSKTCPFDSHTLITTAVSVKKLNGTYKKIHMLVCTECNQKFIVEHSLPNTINIDDCCVRGCELPELHKESSLSQSNNTNQNNKSSRKEFMYSSQYGEGEVIGRVKDKQGTKVTIRFTDCEKVFFEEMALTKGGLKRVHSDAK